MMNIIKSAAVAVAAGTLLLSGCGSKTGATPKAAAAPAVSKSADNGVAALSATQIMESAQKALAGAKSYRLSGNVHQDGDSYWIDLEVAGKNMLGSVSKDGVTRTLLVFDGQQLMRMDEAMLAEAFGSKTAKGLAARLGTSWIKLDEKSSTEMAEWFDVAELLKPAGKLTKGETGISNQRPVISLFDAGGDFRELHVATTGEPLPLKMRMVGGGRAFLPSTAAISPTSRHLRPRTSSICPARPRRNRSRIDQWYDLRSPSKQDRPGPSTDASRAAPPCPARHDRPARC